MQIQRSIFSGMQILIEHEWVADHALVIEKDLIKAIIPEEMVEHHLPATRYEFSRDSYLIPGLIDLHIHGADGKDVMDATPEALATISTALAKEGVTAYLATTLSADNKTMERVLTCISDHMAKEDGAAILGVHLEGSFITRLGAQPKATTEKFNHEQLTEWQNAAGGAIRLVTLAPDYDGASELITQLRRMKVIASIGHTDASYATTCQAISAGCTQATHLFNAMTGIHHREPGAVGAILLADNVATEIIVDGIHLHPAIVELIFWLKGRDKILLVTDAMRAKCLGDGEYELGGQAVEVTGGKATLNDGTLAGSTLTMTKAIENMVHFSKCSLADAVRMASYNPAHVLGITQRKGSISVGKDADLVVLGKDLNVELTMREGRILYTSS